MKYKIIAYQQKFLTIETAKRQIKKPYFIEQFTIHDVDFKDVSKKQIELYTKYNNLVFTFIREDENNNTSLYAWHNEKLGKYRRLVNV